MEPELRCCQSARRPLGGGAGASCEGGGVSPGCTWQDSDGDEGHVARCHMRF